MSIEATPKLILTSDDFGLSTVFNEKILDLLSKKILTSTSVMVHKITHAQKHQVERLIDINNHNAISIGLHLELYSSNYLEEVKTQWQLFENIFGFLPHYLDIHKSSKFEGDFNAIANFCMINNICFRRYKETIIEVLSPDFSITLTRLKIEDIFKIIDNFYSNTNYEFVFHIGVYDPNTTSSLNKEREADIAKLLMINNYFKYSKWNPINFKHLIPKLPSR